MVEAGRVGKERHISLNPTAFVLLGTVVMGLVAAVAVGSFFLGYLSSSFWGLDLPHPQTPVPSVMSGGSLEQAQRLGRASDWERWERKLAELRRRQSQLEEQLRSKSAEAEGRARLAEQLRATLHVQQREISFLRQRLEQLARQPRGFRHSKTVYISPREVTGAPRGFRSDEGPRVRAATTAQSFPAKLVIELSPANPLPGDPYLLGIRIHNSANHSIPVKGLRVVWKIGPRNAGGSVAFEPRRVAPHSVVILHEARGVWLEAFDDVEITVTAELDGGGKLMSTLSRPAS